MITDLKLERIRIGLKQVELARLTGIDRSRLSMIENSWIAPKAEEIQKIKKAICAHGKSE